MKSFIIIGNALAVFAATAPTFTSTIHINKPLIQKLTTGFRTRYHDKQTHK